MTNLLHKQLTGKILRSYYNVYNGIGRTYPEYVYENGMIYDLQQQGIRVQQQDEYQIFYKEWIVGVQRLDLFIAGEVVVEIKVVPELVNIHLAQTYSYLKTLNKRVALLLNFGQSKPEFIRLLYPPNRPKNGLSANKTVSELSPDLVVPEMVYQIIGGLYEVYNLLGSGFLYRIYGNACYRELLSLGLPAQRQHEMQILYRQHPIATVKFAHIRVGSEVLVFPVTVTNLNQISFNNIKDWLRIQQVPLAILANFADVTLKPFFLRV